MVCLFYRNLRTRTNNMVTQWGNFRKTTEQQLLNFFYHRIFFGMWLSHRMKYQPGLIKRMGEYVPAWKRTVKMPLTMRWVVLQNWPEIVRVLWSLRVWERREQARITLWSVARYIIEPEETYRRCEMPKYRKYEMPKYRRCEMRESKKENLRRRCDWYYICSQPLFS